MATVAIYELEGNGGARITCPLMMHGAQACGDKVTYLRASTYRSPECDIAVLWGYVESCQKIINDYVATGRKAVYLDMAYWQRRESYKVCVNARHPNAYFQKVKHGPQRRLQLGVVPRPFAKQGELILLAGMGAKSAWAEHQEPVESWERATVNELRALTDRKIVYRPKPSWAGASSIKGTRFSPPSEALEPLLAASWAVVTHHSNVAIDGLVSGVPAFVWYGAAVPMGLQDLAKIETPLYPDREQWLNDLAYCQWSKEELRNGSCWRHLKMEGLIP